MVEARGIELDHVGFDYDPVLRILHDVTLHVVGPGSTLAIEQSRHRELLERGGMYAKLWALQRQQSELEHVHRALLEQPLSIDALVAGVVDALSGEMATRRVQLDTVVSEGAAHHG